MIVFSVIRILAGIIAPSSGYGVVAGRRTDDKVEELHEVIGLLTESPGLYERLSARRNLEYFAGFYPGLAVAADVPAFLSCEARHRGYKVDRFKRD